jgi:DNA-binding CsgD family transcriptional regulator
VLCSATTADRARLRPDRAWLIDLGSYQLRDFPGEERLFQLGAPGLRRRFPRPRCDHADGARPLGARILPSARPTLDALTRAEAAVARLVGQGLSNPQIAQRLYISRYTVETHLKHIFAKLAISARTELAALVARADQALSGRP